jgi:hypothetical protein
MDDVTYERVLDLRIQMRLRSDLAYLNAANAEEQAERENEIEREEAALLDYEQEHRN